MASTFQNGVMYACFAVLALLACVCMLVGFRQVGMWLRARLCPIALVAFASAAIIATCDAQKRGNEASRAPLPRGEYMVSVTPRSVGETELLPLPGAVTNAKWRARGAFEDAFYIRATNWWARMPDGRWMDRLRILSSGGFRARGVGGGAWTNYPPPFTQKLSLAPEANWPLLGHDSSFWHATTPSNTLVVSWIGGLYARSHTNLVDFQAEIFNDGSLDYRYADRTEHFAASLPFDLDGDGLENSVDPDPLTAGPDAHGTNAEWYNTVCSNVLEAVASGGTGTTGILPVGNGGTGTTGFLPVDDDFVLSWRAEVNSNAYYFVDVVAERGPAPIYFTGDRDSRLGNPVVVALAGVTNRVPLLIGIDYAVTSDTPFTVSFPIDYIHPTVTTNDVADYNVRWPLNFVFTESLTESNRVYTVTVEPYDPGGVFTSDPPLRGAPCGCVSFSGNTIAFGCSPTCECGGICKKGILYYLLGGAAFAATGGVCRCGFDDPIPQVAVLHEPTDPPALSITFSKPAVIFEEAYLDSEYGARPKRSTRVQLTVSAYGGTHGGSLSLSSQNLGKLAAVAGGAINLPSVTNIPPQGSFISTCVYEAATLSSREGDISVTGQFIENDTVARIDSSDTLTSVQLVVSPVTLFPQGYPCRHTFGVCEEMVVSSFPSSLRGFTWESSGGILNNGLSDNQQRFQYLLDEGGRTMTFGFKGARYTVNTMCLRPSDIVSLSSPTILSGNASVGEAGGVGMRMEMTLLPDAVSFKDIRIMERVTGDGVPSGYFSAEYFRPWWNHGMVQGAGELVSIGIGNIFADTAIMEDCCPQLASGGWVGGSIIWTIPTAWREIRGFSVPNGLIDFTTKEQIFTINAAGTVHVEKFNCSVGRDIQGHTNATVNLPEGR